MTLDAVLTEHVGEMRWFQWKAVVLLAYQELFVTVAVLAPVFVAATPQFRCTSPFTTTSNHSNNQIEDLSTQNQSIIQEDQCNIYVQRHNSTDAGTQQTLPCEEWEYDTSVYSSTIVMEWNLVCDKRWLVATVSSVFMVGKSISGLLFGFVADRFGRRPSILGTGVLTVFFSLLCAAMPNITVFLIARFMVALFAIGKHNTSVILASELVGTSWRVIAMNIVFSSWCFGFVLMAVISFFIRDWRMYMLATTLPELIFYVMFYIWIPESPRWLLARGQLEKAEEVMEIIAAVNGTDYPNGALTESIRRDEQFEGNNKKEAVETRTLLDMFKSRHMCLISLNLLFNWFAEAFIYYGLSLHATDFGNNPFISFALSGLVEVPAYLVAPLVSRYLGRIPPFSISLLLGGIVMLCAAFVSTDMSVLLLFFTLAGKFFTTISFSLAWSYSAEVFPTCIRGIGVTTVATGARIGSILSPYVFLLNSVHMSLPFILFGIPVILAGVLVLLMPETRGQPLMQTLEEGERFIKNNKLHCFRKSAISHVDVDIDPTREYLQPDCEDDKA